MKKIVFLLFLLLSIPVFSQIKTPREKISQLQIGDTLKIAGGVWLAEKRVMDGLGLQFKRCLTNEEHIKRLKDYEVGSEKYEHAYQAFCLYECLTNEEYHKWSKLGASHSYGLKIENNKLTQERSEIYFLYHFTFICFDHESTMIVIDVDSHLLWLSSQEPPKEV